MSNPVDVGSCIAAERGCLHCGERMADKCFLDEDDTWEVAVCIYALSAVSFVQFVIPQAFHEMT